MLRTIALLSMLALMTVPVASADHLPGLVNCEENEVRETACLVWNGVLVPTYHGVGTGYENLRAALCEDHGIGC